MNNKPSLIFTIMIVLCLLLPACKQTKQKPKNKKVEKDTNIFIIPPTTISKNVSTKQRKITINNNIDNTMLSYKHWTGTYKPNKFHIFINDKEITNKAYISTIADDQILTIVYEYEFMNGYRTDKRQITFSLDDDIDTINLTFSWHDKWHLLCDHAQPIGAIQL
jgi:hypothetical protein